MTQFTKFFFRGLLILLPVVVTGYVMIAVFQALDEAVFSPIGRFVRWLQGKEARGAEEWVLTALGIAATVTLITVVGALASNFFGRWVVARIEHIVERLPLVKLLYGAIRDVLGAFVGDKKSFDHPVTVSLDPQGGTKVVGFVTRQSLEFLGLAGHVAVYLPQSYNFAGNLVLFPREQVTPIPASSSDVMTFLVSGGVSGQEPKS
jgi:uncharacterized membrane protein